MKLSKDKFLKSFRKVIVVNSRHSLTLHTLAPSMGQWQELTVFYYFHFVTLRSYVKSKLAMLGVKICNSGHFVGPNFWENYTFKSVRD